MPVHENIRVALTSGDVVSLAEAPLGRVLFQFGGAPVLIAVRPQGVAGAEPVRFVVDLDTFVATQINASSDKHAAGVAYPYDVSVDPQSGMLAHYDTYMVGDLIGNGSFLGIVARHHDSKLALTLTPGLSPRLLVAYSGWTLSIDGKPVSTKLDL